MSVDPRPADHDRRMRAARARAQWELGSSGWAETILGAYWFPDDDEATLARERAEPDSSPMPGMSADEYGKAFD